MTDQPQELTGQTAVVTGAASGIGRAVALELAAAGANCVIHGRSRRQAADDVAESVRTFGSDAKVVLADLANETDIEQLAAEAWSWRNGVDIWVNNAGADVLTGEPSKWPFERKLDALWRVDVLATIQLSRNIGQQMKQRGCGVIINIGWDQAEQGMAGDTGELFAATKGAVMAFTRSLAHSLAPQVRVNCIAPGWIKTKWGEKAPDQWQERAERESLLGRWGTPEDIARTARFLASPAASFVNSQIIAVDGGFKHSQ